MSSESFLVAAITLLGVGAYNGFHPNVMIWLTVFVAAAGAAVIYKRLLSPEAQQRASLEKQERERLAQIAAAPLPPVELAKQQYLKPPAHTVSPERFRAELIAGYKLSPRKIVPVFFEQLIFIFVEIYREKPPATEALYQLALTVCVKCLTDFTAKLPEDLLEQPERNSVFHIQQPLEPVVVRPDPKDQYDQMQDGMWDAYSALSKPLKDNVIALQYCGCFNWKDSGPIYHVPVSDPGNFYDHHSQDDYFDKGIRREWDSKVKKWQDAERKASDKAYEEIAQWQTAMLGTPLYMHAYSLLPKGTVNIPFDIPPDARSRHQWIVGAPGAGKTTFISAMIADDLKKVARNEATIFVMDSQNELIPDIASLEMFAPGRPLHNKLIYLEPDPDYPLALNIFDTNLARSKTLSSKERAMIESGAIWMVEFFLSSLVKSDASPHQDTFLNYVIPALMAIPDATIFTFKDLLEGAKAKNGPTGYDRYKQHFGGLRQDTQDWLRDRMHSQELATTRNAIRTRLDGFTARGFFHDMFIHPRNKLDLFEEMRTGKVILVNTLKGLLKNGTEPFGRYFIARLLQAAEERMFLSRDARLPVYVYIDEAADYISEEENIEELINKARKQNVALIIANQMESQITSPIVRDALSRVAIQCRGEAGDVDEPPKWQIALGNREPVQIQVPNVNFANMPKMSKTNFEHMLADMRRRFSSAAVGNGHAEPPHQRDRPQGTNTSQWDVEWTAELSPKLAETGGIKTIHGFAIRIKPNTRNGTRVRLSGKGAKRPDGSFADAYITFTVQTRPDQPMLGTSGYYADERSETDAKPW